MMRPLSGCLAVVGVVMSVPPFGIDLWKSFPQIHLPHVQCSDTTGSERRVINTIVHIQYSRNDEGRSSMRVPLQCGRHGVCSWRAFPATIARTDRPDFFAAASLTNASRTSPAPGRRAAARRSAFHSPHRRRSRGRSDGAPAAIFASADEAWMDYLAHRRTSILPRAARRGQSAGAGGPRRACADDQARAGVDLVASSRRAHRHRDPAHVPSAVMPSRVNAMAMDRVAPGGAC